MKTAVVIPNWNGIGLLDRCLDSLKNQTVPVHVILVDNGSTDRSVKLVENSFPEVEVVKLDHNYGFTGGVNAGIEAALAKNYEYIALFNNDAEAAVNWIETLTGTMDSDASISIVASKMLAIDRKKLDSTGEQYSIWGTPFPRGRGEIDTGQYDSEEQRPVFAASGGASLYRAELFKQIGMFDQRFFAYYEDVDISFRAQLAGWSVRYEPKAHVYHHIGGTSSKLGSFSQYHMLKNMWYLYAKNMPRKLFWRHLPKVIIGLKLKSFSLLAHLQFKPVLKAWGDIFTNLASILRDRRQIQRDSVVSAETIDALLYHDLSPTQKQKKLYRLLSRSSNG
ncbi:MAG: glycosyltransferase family 2 protein [Candidatus Saccharimonadales bacterium]